MKRFRTAVFMVGTATVLACILALVWAFVLRERSVRKLYAEYMVFRALTALTDLVRDPDAVLTPDDRILGFGLYRPDGIRVLGYGRTPELLTPEILRDPASALRFTESSLVLVRSFGMDPMRRSGPAWQGRPGLGMMMHRGNAARYAYIEYGLGPFRREQGMLLAGASAVTAMLGAAWLLLARLYRRNLALRERENRNRELVQLGEAARILVHEIKNPLGVIRVQSALLARTVGRSAPEGFDIIDAEVQRLGNLVDRIRDFLKSGEGRPETVDLPEFLDDWKRRHADGVRLTGSFPDGTAVRVDRRRLADMLDNLVRNALESMEGSDGSVEAEVYCAVRKGFAVVSVADRGAGVEPRDVPQLFEPFHTTKEDGSGIGLALSARRARSAGGDIAYRPRDGGGSVFELRLPLIKGKVRPAEEEPGRE